MEGIIGKKVEFFVERDGHKGDVLDKVRLHVPGSGSNADYYVIVDTEKKIHTVNPINLYKLL